MNYIALAQLLLAAGYCLFIFKKYGVLNSISASYYKRLEDNNSRDFVIFCWGLGLPMFLYQPVWQAQLCFMLAGFLLCIVGIASHYKEKFVDKIHNVGSFGAIVLGFAGIVFQDHLWSIPTVVLFLVSCLLIIKKRVSNRTWWVEVAAIVCIFGRLIIKT